MGRHAAPAPIDDDAVRARNLARLRANMQKVTSLEQFANIVASARPEHQDRFRSILTPMLRAGLPCCTGKRYGLHTPGCLATLQELGVKAAH